MVDVRRIFDSIPKTTVMRDDNSTESTVAVGVVIEALPNAMFRVEFENGETQIAYLAGKMRVHRIKVLVGDKVQVLIDPYGGKGRINRRL